MLAVVMALGVLALAGVSVHRASVRQRIADEAAVRDIRGRWQVQRLATLFRHDPVRYVVGGPYQDPREPDPDSTAYFAIEPVIVGGVPAGTRAQVYLRPFAPTETPRPRRTVPSL